MHQRFARHAPPVALLATLLAVALSLVGCDAAMRPEPPDDLSFVSAVELGGGALGKTATSEPLSPYSCTLSALSRNPSAPDSARYQLHVRHVVIPPGWVAAGEVAATKVVRYRLREAGTGRVLREARCVVPDEARVTRRVLELLSVSGRTGTAGFDGVEGAGKGSTSDPYVCGEQELCEAEETEVWGDPDYANWDDRPCKEYGWDCGNDGDPYSLPEGASTWTGGSSAATPWDIADWFALGLSLSDFVQDPTLRNFGWLVLDVLGAGLPVVPTTGIFRHGARLIDSATDALKTKSIFVQAANGTNIPIPRGFQAGNTYNGTGIAFQKPGSSGNANLIRIMDPGTRYPSGYMVYYNSGGRPLDVMGNDFYMEGGRRVFYRDNDPRIHHPLGGSPIPGLAQWFRNYNSR